MFLLRQVIPLYTFVQVKTAGKLLPGFYRMMRWRKIQAN